MTTLILSKSRGRLGITCENHRGKPGALVTGLVEGSAAADSGLHVGDFIVSVNNYPVDSHKDCIWRIDQAPDVLQIGLERPTRVVTLDKAYGRVGITCQDAFDGVGVEISAIIDGSLATEAGVSVGDTLLAVNGTMAWTHTDAVDLIDGDDVVELTLRADTRSVELAKAGSGKKLGVTVANNPEGSGVVVVGLVRGGLAATALQTGDVLLAVDDQLAVDHRTAIGLLDGNPGTLRLLVGPPVYDLERVIERSTSFGRSQGADMSDVQFAMEQPFVELVNIRR